MAGSESTNQVTIPIIPGVGSVFLRMVYPRFCFGNQKFLERQRIRRVGLTLTGRWRERRSRLQ